MRFRDRSDAGTRLAELIAPLGLREPIVLGLPRGGVVVAYEVAERLGGSLDVFVTRKVGAPGQAEYGIGAVAEGGVVFASPAVAAMGLSNDEFASLATAEQVELERRVRCYRGERATPPIAGRDVVVVDDGLATGVTAEAAIRGVRAHAPRRLVLAVPVAAASTVDRLARQVDDVVVIMTPDRFYAVGDWYDDFAQTTDAEVITLLERSAARD